MATVILRPNESDSFLLKRFRKKVMRSGVLSENRKRRWFISKNEKKRIEEKKSTRRLKRKQMKTNRY